MVNFLQSRRYEISLWKWLKVFFFASYFAAKANAIAFGVSIRTIGICRTFNGTWCKSWCYRWLRTKAHSFSCTIKQARGCQTLTQEKAQLGFHCYKGQFWFIHSDEHLLFRLLGSKNDQILQWMVIIQWIRYQVFLVELVKYKWFIDLSYFHFF